MPYCPHCGGEVAQLPGAEPVHEAPIPEVEVARINAERDIAVARLQARQDSEQNETEVEVAAIEAEAEVAAAEAQAEVVAEVLNAGDEPEPEGEPIVVEAPADPEPDIPPPPAAEEHHEPSSTSTRHRGFF